MLNSKAITFGELISGDNINNGSSLFPRYGQYIHTVAVGDPTKITGLPLGAYGYGMLFTVVTKYAFSSGQIYITHSSNGGNTKLFVRTLQDQYNSNASWRMFNPEEIVNQNN